MDRYVPDWYAPLYATITPEEEVAAAQLACLDMLRTGTTTFCEAGTLFDVPAVAQGVDAVGHYLARAGLAARPKWPML